MFLLHHYVNYIIQSYLTMIEWVLFLKLRQSMPQFTVRGGFFFSLAFKTVKHALSETSTHTVQYLKSHHNLCDHLTILYKLENLFHCLEEQQMVSSSLISSSNFKRVTKSTEYTFFCTMVKNHDNELNSVVNSSLLRKRDAISHFDVHRLN